MSRRYPSNKQYLKSKSDEDLSSYCKRKIRKKNSVEHPNLKIADDTLRAEERRQPANEATCSRSSDEIASQNISPSVQTAYDDLEDMGNEFPSITRNDLLGSNDSLESLNVLSPEIFDVVFDDEASTEDPDQDRTKYRKKPDTLNDLMKTPGFFDIISTPLSKSPGEILLMTLKFAISNMLTQTAISNLLQLINNLFIQPIFPHSRYFIDKLFNVKSDVEFHAVCPSCSEYIGKVENVDFGAVCTVCDANVDLSSPSCLHFFAMINPSSAIVDHLQTYQDHYDYVVRDRRHEKKHIKDIYDGKCYRQFVSSLPDEVKQNYATVTFNTDGIPAFESSQNSIWPIQLMINELPVQERFRNLVTCGLWFGKSKPNMDIFMKPFRDMMNKISTSGIECEMKGGSRLIKVYGVTCCVDAVARAPMQGIKQFNGTYGCGWCLHPGVYMEEAKSLKYPTVDHTPEARNLDNTVAFMEEFRRTKKPVRGVQSISPLLNLIAFNIVFGFVPDYMHCILIGVAKQITELMLNLLSSEDLNFLSDQLKYIKAPNQLARLTRPLTDRKFWKAREWENWVLYYSLPILSLKLERKFTQHWGLLVESLYILLQTDITYDQLEH